MYRMVGQSNLHCDTEKAGAPICQIIRWQYNGANPVISQEICPIFPSHKVFGGNRVHFNAVKPEHCAPVYYVNVRISLVQLALHFHAIAI